MKHRIVSLGCVITSLLLIAGTAAPGEAEICHEVFGFVSFQGLQVVPERPTVGETVELRFGVHFQVYGVGAVTVLGADPVLEGTTTTYGSADPVFHLTAVQVGQASVQLQVTYHTELACDDGEGHTYFQQGPDHTVKSPPYVVEVAETTTTVTPTPPATATPTPTSTERERATPGPCVGDCNTSRDVKVDELVTMVNVALGIVPLSACAVGDGDGFGDITIDEIMKAVNNALLGCPFCGDGTRNQASEQCEPPFFCRGGCNPVTHLCVDIGCKDDCTCPPALCGDSVVDVAEQCDPPGSLCADGGACSTDCSCP